MLSAVTTVVPAMPESGDWYVVLHDIHFTRCHGPDSSRFLQGQLSCNLQKLSVTHSLRGALCNLKGRVITDLQLISHADSVLILTRHGMHNAMLPVLNKYRVFFKTALDDAGSRFSATGLGEAACQLLADDAGITLPDGADQTVACNGLTLIAMPGSAMTQSPCFLCIVDTENADARGLLDNLQGKVAEMPESLWQLADIRSGTVHVRPDQSEVFTPQLLNYDINGIIDFKKGCYTGQEIVARMYYKAEAKRRLHHVRFTSELMLNSALNDHDMELVSGIILSDGSVEVLAVISEKSLPAVAAQASLTSFSAAHSL